MVVEPTATDDDRPRLSSALLMVATADTDDDQVTCLVRSCVLLSENVPVAVNCWSLPKAIDGLAGETCMDVKLAPLTVSVVEPCIAPFWATMLVVPGATPVANPLDPDALLIVAAAVLVAVQETSEVTSRVLPSESVAVAAN
jgi:hypothetical protein